MAKGDPLHTIDIFKETGIKVPKKNQREALEASAEFIREQILLNTGEGKTSVQGGKWKRKLSKGYADKKADESTANFANMELSGDMLDALEVRAEGGKVTIEVTGDQADKAEGNLLGSYGRSPDPSQAREFMPHARGQKLKKDIMEGVAEILQEYADEQED